MSVPPARRSTARDDPSPLGLLAVTTRPAYGGMILAVSGELDVAVTGDLNAHVDAAIAQGLVHLVLDLQGLDFCDCAGLGALLRARRLTSARQGWTRLAAVRPRVARIIHIAGLESALACYPSAVHAFTDSPERLPSPAL